VPREPQILLCPVFVIPHHGTYGDMGIIIGEFVCTHTSLHAPWHNTKSIRITLRNVETAAAYEM